MAASCEAAAVLWVPAHRPVPLHVPGTGISPRGQRVSGLSFSLGSTAAAVAHYGIFNECFRSFTSENSCCGNGQGATPAPLRALRPPREVGLHRAGMCSPAGCSLPGLRLLGARSWCWVATYRDGSYTQACMREGHQQCALWKRFC